jgi:hypothetical protein
MAPGTSRHLPAACTSGAGAAEPYAELVMLRDATGDDASNADAALAARSRDVSTTASIGWVLIGPRRPMWGRGHACDSDPFASAAAILGGGIAVVSQGRLTPLLRRKTLIGSGSEECPTCAPNQRRSTQPPVTVTGRVTSEPGCSRETPTHPTNKGISCRLQRWPAMERR